MVSLDASDGFLRERVMNLPEKVVTGTHYTEEGVCVCVCACVVTLFCLYCLQLCLLRER